MSNEKEIVKQLTRIADAQERIASVPEQKEQKRERESEVQSDSEKMKEFLSEKQAQ
ncbi:hypothetical protein [Peribacillus cavernae]|uniref:hypothetical protein n=1 Tax=Peribacillus cavernae TaxID=1674310 RepID=UPI00163C0EE0|nr:hypothetical protein [Peribacillus cavernae]MDQ0219170.1 hypothetical protein [Peribacillus cavernae]